MSDYDFGKSGKPRSVATRLGLSRACGGLLALLCCQCTQAGTSVPTPSNAARPFSERYENLYDPRRFAVITVACDIGIDGLTSNCHAVDAGQKDFEQSALEYARSIYEPMVQDGQPTTDPGHIFHIEFIPPGGGYFRSSVQAEAYPGDPLDYPASVSMEASADVTLTCTIKVDGTTSDCAVKENTGDPAFASVALLAARARHYMPAWSDGHPHEETDHKIVLHFPVREIHFPGEPAKPEGVKVDVLQRVRPEYPEEMIERMEDGAVLVVCNIGLDQHNHDCSVAGRNGSQAFEKPAMDAASSYVVRATQSGQVVAVEKYPYLINFRVNRDVW
jgi:hypothetical protein